MPSGAPETRFLALGRPPTPPRSGPNHGGYPPSTGPKWGGTGPKQHKTAPNSLAPRLGDLGPGPRRFVAYRGRAGGSLGTAAPRCACSGTRSGQFWVVLGPTCGAISGPGVESKKRPYRRRNGPNRDSKGPFPPGNPPVLVVSNPRNGSNARLGPRTGPCQGGGEGGRGRLPQPPTRPARRRSILKNGRI